MTLFLLGHPEDVVARELPDHLRMAPLDVGLDLADELAVGLGSHDLSTFTVDDLAHDPPPSLENSAIVPPPAWRYLGETLATGKGTRIQLCGPLVVELGGRRVEAELPGRQGRVLLAYLASTRSRRSTRAELVDALWPEGAPDAAEASLAALLSKLRRVLGPEAMEGKAELRLTLPGEAWIDVEAAGVAVHRAESAVALEQWEEGWAPARTALYVANRGFLPGYEAPWIEERRRWLDDLRLRALECVGTIGLNMGGTELAAAERAGRSLVEAAPFRESGYRLLMEALEARGNVAEALRVFDGLRVLLREELGVAPGQAAQELHRRLLTQVDAVRPSG
jgi:DNA-binding SARP family transcriptional activator